MTGSEFLLLIGVVALVVLVKYSEHVKSAYTGIVRAVGTSNGTSAVPAKKGNGSNKIVKIALIVFGAIVIVFLIVWLWPSQSSSLQSPTTGEVWGWTKGHWLWIILFLAILFVLSYLIPKESKKYEPIAKTARVMLVLAVPTLFIVIPVVDLLWGDKPQLALQEQKNVQKNPQSEIPLATAPQSSWPKLVIPANGRTGIITVPPQMHIKMNGNDFLLHNAYQDGRECAFGESCVAGPLKGNYATNEVDRENIVSYAFAPD